MKVCTRPVLKSHTLIKYQNLEIFVEKLETRNHPKSTRKTIFRTTIYYARPPLYSGLAFAQPLPHSLAIISRIPILLVTGLFLSESYNNNKTF